MENAGHTVTEVYSRNLAHAEALADCLYDTTPVDGLDLSGSEAEIVFICVPDDAIEDIARQLVLPAPDVIVAHTSGTRSLNLLNFAGGISAVFYPLQTFSRKRKADFSQIPVCLECPDEAAMELLKNTAASLGGPVYEINGPERMVLHLAAVFACNFSNYLYSVASDLLEAEDMSFAMLQPLIHETLQKAADMGPAAAQTGPAIRRDRKTMQAHLNYLQANPELQELYTQLSDAIIRNS